MAEGDWGSSQFSLSHADVEGSRGHCNSRQEGKPPNQLNDPAAPSRMSDGSLKGDAGITGRMSPTHEMAFQKGSETGISGSNRDCNGPRLLLCHHGMMLMLKLLDCHGQCLDLLGYHNNLLLLVWQ